MLYTQKLIAELQRKRDQFAAYQARYGQQLAAYREALSGLGSRYSTAQSLRRVQADRLDRQGGSHSPGAFPTSEYDRWQ